MSFRSTHSSGLRLYSKLVASFTFFLIFAGGMVTSTGSGLAVPDWPLSYGMLFPPMVGGVFYEHGHRLLAATVGFLTLILVVIILWKETRVRVKRLAVFAIVSVILQGALGGITVLWLLPTVISMAHAVLGQTFFLLTLILAYSFSKEWQERKSLVLANPGHAEFYRMTKWLLFVVYLQLILAAWMRHTESGLAIPDFPRMGHQWLPMFDDAMFTAINGMRYDLHLDPIHFTNIWIHLSHRIGAVLVLVCVFVVTKKARKFFPTGNVILKTVYLILACVLCQIVLGAMVIWTHKAPIITSLHVVLGAGILGGSTLLLLRSYPLGDKAATTDKS